MRYTCGKYFITFIPGVPLPVVIGDRVKIRTKRFPHNLFKRVVVGAYGTFGKGGA